MLTTPSLDAYRSLPGNMAFCSWRAGWRSLLVRAFDDPPETEEFITLPTHDQLIVLVTKGSCEIESFRSRQWHRAAYRPGHIGMTAPSEMARLRWRGPERHTTLQLHLPTSVIAAVSDDLRDENVRTVMPSFLALRDSTVATMMLALHRGALAGAPDLYAETGAHFLAAHLLVSHCHVSAWSKPGVHRDALRQADAYMRAHLAEPLSLGRVAGAAGISRFQLLRAAKSGWRETPLHHLTRLRMERARRFLLSSRCSIAEISAACDYENRAHFATAFKRHFGARPSDFRKR